MNDNSIGKLLIEQKIVTPAVLEEYRRREQETGQSLTTLLEKDGILTRRDLIRMAVKVSRRRELPDVLISEGYITTEQLQKVLRSRAGNKRGIGSWLIEKGMLTEEQLMRSLAVLHELPFNDLTEFKPSTELLDRVGQERMEKFRCIPLSETSEFIDLAVGDPGNIVLLEEMASQLGKKVRLQVTTLSAIQLFLSTHFESRVSLSDFSREMGRRNDELPSESDVEQVSLEALGEEDSPVVRMIHTLIYNAIERRASDIHFEVYEREVKVKYRIDGVLFEALSEIDRQFIPLIITRIKIMAELDIAEHRVPQDGRFMLQIDSRNVDFRVSILPSIYGETAVIRILDKLTLSLEVGSLGFPPEQMKRFMDCIRRPHGMVLVAGPTGSGKTTTLYSALKAIQKKEEKIITIEDPVEYQLADIVQVPVNEKKGLTFARGLRSIVRQDPDIIMIGEIRDLDTAQIAINAALTGHLVLTTIHSNNVIDALTRLVNIGVEEYQFASSFNMIMAQRLLRKVCNACKIEEISAHSSFKGETIWRGKGCRFCNESGFYGRTAIFEMLELEDDIRELILEKKNPIQIKRLAIEKGVKFLRDAAIEKVRAGLTTPEEIDRVTYDERR